MKLLIQACNAVILAFDNLEELRILSRLEYNFRKIVEMHLENLLHLQYIYSKHICTIRWIRVGEENSEFFQAMETERFRRNTIASLKNENGVVVTKHQQMAGLLWGSFRNRMGVATGIDIQFDLATPIQKIPGLEALSAPFSQEEINEVLKHLPVDRAPGPYGFTGLFVKRCWDIIKDDFLQLFQDFWEGKINLASINGSLVTLMPKILSPEGPNDFRPISLTNTCLKFLTKLLTNTLQKAILNCIHKNQYGFLKCRSIQYCIAWTLEYIHQCHVSKNPILIVKLDFAKAYDTIEHDLVLQMLKYKEFDDKWIAWIRELLSSGTSSILLNGVPGKQFMCKKGVRQGDPLSTMLFIIATDLLQIVTNDMLERGDLTLPINTNDTDFPIVRYANDTLLILPAVYSQLLALKEMLHAFHASTGLKVNFHKSCILPIKLIQMKLLDWLLCLVVKLGLCLSPILGNQWVLPNLESKIYSQWWIEWKED